MRSEKSVANAFKAIGTPYLDIIRWRKLWECVGIPTTGPRERLLERACSIKCKLITLYSLYKLDKDSAVEAFGPETKEKFRLSVKGAVQPSKIELPGVTLPVLVKAS